MEYIKPIEEWKSNQKVLIQSKLEVLHRIAEKLSPAQKEIFRKTSFGHFLDVKVEKSMPQILHHLSLRMCANDNEEELVFKVQDKYLHFGIKDFCLIMGLRSNSGLLMKKRNVQKKSNIEQFFQSYPLVKKKQIKDAFEDYNGMDDDIMLKLAKLHLVENFLLAKQDEGVVKLEHIEILDNYSNFEDYHWGRLSLKATIKGMRKLSTMKQEAKFYSLPGCPYALQVWAYEKFSTMSKFVRRRTGNITPRICKWTSKKQPRFAKLSVEIFDNSELVLNDITPTETELSKAYMKEFMDPNSIHSCEENVQQLQLHKLIEQNIQLLEQNKNMMNEQKKLSLQVTEMRKELTEIRKIVTGIQPITGRKSKDTLSELEESDGHDDGRDKVAFDDEVIKDSFEENVVKETQQRDKEREEKNPNQEFYDGINTIARETLQNIEVIVDADKGVELKDSNEEKNEAIESSSKEKAERKEKAIDVSAMEAIVKKQKEDDKKREKIILRKRKIKPGPVERTPYTTRFGSAEGQPSKKKRSTNSPPSSCSPPSFDLKISQLDTISPKSKSLDPKNKPQPLSIEIDKEPDGILTKEFEDWIRIGLNQKRGLFDSRDKLDQPLNFGIGEVTTRSWFYKIWKPTERLSTDHMNIVFYYLRKKLLYNKTKFKQRCTTLDSIADNYITSAWKSYKSNKYKFSWNTKPNSFLVDYINGEKIAAGTNWKDVDYVYIPVFVESIDHFVLVQIDLVHRKMLVYDSMAGKKHNKVVNDKTSAIKTIIENLLQYTSFFGKGKSKEEYNFELELVKNMDVQQNGSDCGMFVIKRAEALMTDISLDEITEEKMPFFRKKLAVELYNWADLKQKTGCISC